MSATALDVMEHQSFGGYFAGTAVTLTAPRKTRRISAPGAPAPFDELASMLLTETNYGVSDSAAALQLIMSLITPDLDRWRATIAAESLDIEKEIVVLLPPKNRRKVVVRAHHAGPARPLIDTDDIP